MKYINRAKVREQMDVAAAVRAGQTTQKDYKQWRREMMEEAR